MPCRRELFHDLLSAFRQDVTTLRYPAYGDVLDYCRRSANPIGRLLLHLYDAVTPANLAHSDAICTGLQLVNFWQDIAIDWRKQPGLPAAGGPGPLRGDRGARSPTRAATSAGARCSAFETARARALLASGRPLPRALPWRLALELRGVLAGGHRILDAIDAVHGDVFRHRPRLRARDWGVVAAHALFPPRRHRGAALPA